MAYGYTTIGEYTYRPYSLDALNALKENKIPRSGFIMVPLNAASVEK